MDYFFDVLLFLNKLSQQIISPSYLDKLSLV